MEAQFSSLKIIDCSECVHLCLALFVMLCPPDKCFSVIYINCAISKQIETIITPLYAYLIYSHDVRTYMYLHIMYVSITIRNVVN